MMKTCAAAAAIAMAPALAHADVMAFTGWENTSADAAFGTTGNVGDFGYTSAPDPVYAGNHSMFMTEDPLSSTPNAVVAWVSGIEAGDEITATMWFRGMDSVGSNTAKARLWGGYYDATDTSEHAGSAGGPSGFAGNNETWESMTHTWTVDGTTSIFGLEVRIYAYGDNNMIWGDNLEISVNNDNATIEVAGSASTPVVPGPAIGIAMLGGLAVVGRRRR